jgi:molecular chaperone HscA
LSALERALAVDGPLLSPLERTDIDAQMVGLRQAAAGDDHRAIRERTEKLDLATKPFAERRMNEGIRRAIGGQQVGAIEKQVEHAKGTAAHEGIRD